MNSPWRQITMVSYVVSVFGKTKKLLNKVMILNPGFLFKAGAWKLKLYNLMQAFSGETCLILGIIFASWNENFTQTHLAPFPGSAWEAVATRVLLPDKVKLLHNEIIQFLGNSPATDEILQLHKLEFQTLFTPALKGAKFPVFHNVDVYCLPLSVCQPTGKHEKTVARKRDIQTDEPPLVCKTFDNSFISKVGFNFYR